MDENLALEAIEKLKLFSQLKPNDELKNSNFVGQDKIELEKQKILEQECAPFDLVYSLLKLTKEQLFSLSVSKYTNQMDPFTLSNNKCFSYFSNYNQIFFFQKLKIKD